jgi:colanic acid/amylovoran biosynthesis glycosyltransferase
MRIAFIVDSFPQLSETFILDQITGLLDLGHDIRIFPTWPRQPQHAIHADVEKYGLMERVSYIPPTPGSKFIRPFMAAWLFLAGLIAKPRRTILLFWLFFTHLRDFSLRHLYFLSRFPVSEFDIVHCHYGTNGLFALYLRRLRLLTKVPLVVTFHGYDLNCMPLDEAARTYHKLFDIADVITANSEFMRQKLVTIGCNPVNLVLVPVGVNLTKIPFTQRTGRPAVPVRLLTVGRLTEVKGYEYSLKAVSRIGASHNVIYEIVGDGPLAPTLKRLTDELGLADRVRFLGGLPHDQAIAAYGRADIFVLAGVRASSGEEETQGLVIQEAQASGLPVVATRCGGMPEGLLDGQTGILVPEKDAGAIAAAVERLIDDAEMRLKFGSAGRLFVKDRYDIRKLNARLEEIYRSLLS